jgi:hypothetical protein
MKADDSSIESGLKSSPLSHCENSTSSSNDEIPTEKKQISDTIPSQFTALLPHQKSEKQVTAVERTNSIVPNAPAPLSPSPQDPSPERKERALAPPPAALPPDLRALIQKWPSLPPNIRAAITALAAVKESCHE